MDSKDEKKRIHDRLEELKKEVTKLGHDYVSLLPKPIPLDELISKLKPWGEVEKSITKLKSEFSELPF